MLESQFQVIEGSNGNRFGSVRFVDRIVSSVVLGISARGIHGILKAKVRIASQINILTICQFIGNSLETTIYNSILKALWAENVKANNAIGWARQ